MSIKSLKKIIVNFIGEEVMWIPQIQVHTTLATAAGVVKKAVRLLLRIVLLQARGGRVELVEPDERREVLERQ